MPVCVEPIDYVLLDLVQLFFLTRHLHERARTVVDEVLAIWV